MIVYKYFLKLAYRLKSYAILFLVIFMAMGLSQVLGNNEVTGFKETQYQVMIKDESGAVAPLSTRSLPLFKKIIKSHLQPLAITA